MKWIYGIRNKFLASVALLVLCLLVLLSNFLDRIHTQNVKNSIVTLYEDRIIAEDYMLKMTSTVYQIREVLNKEITNVSKSKEISKQMFDFNYWYDVYSKTKLTPTEKEIALELISYITIFEQGLLRNNYEPSDFTDKALFSLNELSAVQLEESKLIMENAEAEYVAIKATSLFAFAIIIIILLVLQTMVFSAKALVPEHLPKDPRLN